MPKSNVIDMEKLTKKIGEAIKKEKNKIIDDFCDKHNVSDKKRKEFKKVNPIKIY